MGLEAPPPSSEDRAAVAGLAGLCALCAHLQVLRSRRSTFVRCALHDRDPGSPGGGQMMDFPRYPRLPVARCSGFSPAGTSSAEGGSNDDAEGHGAEGHDGEEHDDT